MSLEQQISELKDAILHLTAAIAAKSAPTVTVSAPAPAMPPAPIAPPPPAPVPPPVTVSAAPTMPAPPTFLAAPAPAAPAVPFSDSKGLIEYVMAAYKEMGREKGAGIGDVLKGLGLSAINEVQPSQYVAFYTAVEALK